MLSLTSTELASEPPATATPLNIEAAYSAHAGFIARALKRLLDDGTHVEDLLQETFIVAFKRSPSFDPERAELRAWLYGIARNLARRHRRTHSRMHRKTQAYQARAEMAEVVPIDQGLVRAEAARRVQAVVNTLPFKQREVFVLFELEGLDGRAIAEVCDIPLGTVWTRLKKARATFEKKIRRSEGMEGAQR